MDVFKVLTPVTCWIFTAIWLYILYFCLKRLQSGVVKSGLTVILLIILTIEAFRTLFESVYFGVWYTSLQGLIPPEIHALLTSPGLVIILMIFDIAATLAIITILIRRWIPQEKAYDEERGQLLKKHAQDLVYHNKRLAAEITRRETSEQQLMEHRKHLEAVVAERTAELAESNQKLDKAYSELDQIFNNASVGIRVIDLDYNVLRVNEMLLEMTGLSREEIGSRKCHQMFRGPSCHTEACTLKQIREGEKQFEMEVEKVTDGGGITSYLLTAAPYCDNRGEVIGVIESFLDISNRKRIEKAFKDERDLFLEGVVGVFKWRNDDNWTADYVSPNVRNILGYRAQDFLEQKIFYKDLIDKRDLPRVVQRKAESSDGATQFLEHAPYRLRHKNGSQVWVLDSTRFVRNTEGVTEYLHGYIIDINQFKMTEEKLENQAQLAHTGRLTALGEMASGMAHELNQPMTVIRLAADGLKMHFDLQDPGSGEAESVNDIILQVKRAARIIKNMRSFSHASGGFVQLVDISEPIESALSFFMEQFRIHQITISKSIAEDLPPVKVDPQKFEQIVVNLLSNARYAVEKKNEYAGEEYVMTVVIRLYLSEDGGNVVFEVEDNGIGMPPDIIRRCMEPFYTTKDIGEGTGLGLSIIHGIVKEFGMEIKIESETEEYCRIGIIIPLQNSDAG